MSEERGRRDAAARLLAIPKFGAGVGLHRVRAMLEDPRADPGAGGATGVYTGAPCATWMESLDAIKVTGSNGKGSVCAMTGAILRALGTSVGVYTSPHLYRFHERIAIDGREVSEEALAEAAGWFEERAAAYLADHPGDAFGAFEAFTAVAMRCFARARPDALVLEAGIGGRFDSTRAVPGELVALTSIDLEHTALLGATEELIAYDKADLCPEGGTLVAGQLAPDLARRVEAYCALRRVRVLHAPRMAEVRGVHFGPEHMTVDVTIDGRRWRDLRVALRGHHQVTNAVVSVLLVREWARRHLPACGDDELERAAREGLASLRWPGRFEKVRSAPDVFVDVGHSPDAIDALAATVRGALAGRRIVLVTGVSYDKAVAPIVERLLPLAAEVICSRAHHKGAPVEEIERIARAAAPGMRVEAAATIEEAAARAVERARETGSAVLVAGGLFLAVEAAEAVRGRDPRALAFL